ncbi:unnamed protein product [Linum tenue]|uniref:Uncharacterized protein n=1 Tax=Linum tenue TaxID=586396 RepID=A0AAV0J537_9ROSI|nr:unnamed protein product [Linum tenue]
MLPTACRTGLWQSPLSCVFPYDDHLSHLNGSLTQSHNGDFPDWWLRWWFGLVGALKTAIGSAIGGEEKYWRMLQQLSSRRRNIKTERLLVREVEQMLEGGSCEAEDLGLDEWFEVEVLSYMPGTYVFMRLVG